MKKWKPSKTAKREFAEKMQNIAAYCSENGITQSMAGDSYYFTLNGRDYRVSNHSIERSNATQRERGGEIYHAEGREANTTYIHASKTRIIEIYEALKAGKELDGRGYVMEA